jgi:hypothetical protein
MFPAREAALKLLRRQEWTSPLPQPRRRRLASSPRRHAEPAAVPVFAGTRAKD